MFWDFANRYPNHATVIIIASLVALVIIISSLVDLKNGCTGCIHEDEDEDEDET
jgi:hypothetical protein